MSKRGRKGVYEEKIKSKFSYIKSALEKGATEKQVAKSLGVAYSTWNKYKTEKEEFAEFLKRDIDRSELIEDLKGALIKKALGFNYSEKKVTKRTEGGKTVEYQEVTEKYSPPDVAAINLALKNYDKENWSNDWQAYNIKREELELKKQIAEKDNW